MFKFMLDIFRYPWQTHNPNNKLYQIFQFLFKEYPAFLRTKPQIKKVIILPFIVISKIISSDKPKEGSAQEASAQKSIHDQQSSQTPSSI